MGVLLALTLLIIPFALTIWNIYTLVLLIKSKNEKHYNKVLEVMAMLLGLWYLDIYMELENIRFAHWYEQLYIPELHSMISPDYYETILTLFLIAVVGYLVVRFVPAHKQSPIISVLGISALYLGIVICVIWCIQTYTDLFLVLLPANCTLIFVKTICMIVFQKNSLIQDKSVSLKYKRLSGFLNKAANLPWVALLLLIPLLGIVVAILFLFGQEPSSLIKAWTETADWTLSQKIAPQNIPYDGHYLCTVAAGGHRRVVKPIRTGIRHDHCVVVNRQLCVANAFEQVLMEKTPKLHKAVRKIYDRSGYPISKYIHSKFLADVIYLIMKPLEWGFLLVLYTVDVNPENRIAIQYPHAKIPDCIM